MKITILIGAFLPCPALKGGAVEKRWYELARRFKEKGHAVEIISKKWEGLSNGIDEYGIQHTRIEGYKAPSSIFIRLIQDFWYTARALYLINKDTDVVITNTFWAPLIAQGILRKKIFVDVARMPKGQLKFYKGVGRMRANSTPVEKAIIDEIGKDQKVICIPNPLPFELKDQNRILEKENTILFVGRIHPEKGVHLLIEAFNRLNEQSWTLKIVGPHEISAGGGGEQYIESLYQLIGKNNVKFLGSIYDRDLLIKEYEKSMIFAYPSLAEKGETFGLAPLEAMACGSIPLLSSLECFADFVTDNYNGVFFNHRANDNVDQLMVKLKFLIKNEELRKTLSDNARQVNKSHSSEMIADLFLTDFEKVILEYSS